MSRCSNDAHGELVGLRRVVANHLDELVRQFRWALTSREMFRWAQLQHVDTLTDIQRAARFFYLQRLAFGGMATGQTFGTSPTRHHSINLLRLEEDLSAAHLRLHRVVIENYHGRRASCAGTVRYTPMIGRHPCTPGNASSTSTPAGVQ